MIDPFPIPLAIVGGKFDIYQVIYSVRIAFQQLLKAYNVHARVLD